MPILIVDTRGSRAVQELEGDLCKEIGDKITKWAGERTANGKKGSKDPMFA